MREIDTVVLYILYIGQYVRYVIKSWSTYNAEYIIHSSMKKMDKLGQWFTLTTYTNDFRHFGSLYHAKGRLRFIFIRL